MIRKPWEFCSDSAQLFINCLPTGKYKIVNAQINIPGSISIKKDLFLDDFDSILISNSLRLFSKW